MPIPSRKLLWGATLLAASVLALGPAAAIPVVPASLGAAGAFAVLGASTVTNTGATTLHGDAGVSPGSALTGGTTITLTGASAYHVSDSVAQTARADAATAFDLLVARPPTADLSGTVLGTGGSLGYLTPGTFAFDTSAQITGTLTLDFQGLSNAAFVFAIGSTLTTASASAITVLNGDASDSIYFLVGSAATLGTSTDFAGNIIARESIALTTSARILCGRAIALTAAVTMDNNTISNSCANGGDIGSGRTDYGSTGFSGVADSSLGATGIPEPQALLLLLAALGLTALARPRIPYRIRLVP